ncbi:MAG: hypothetical protein ABWZ41_00825, partial [Burkholderiales bacterium]
MKIRAGSAERLVLCEKARCDMCEPQTSGYGRKRRRTTASGDVAVRLLMADQRNSAKVRVLRLLSSITQYAAGAHQDTFCVYARPARRIWNSPTSTSVRFKEL